MCGIAQSQIWPVVEVQKSLTFKSSSIRQENEDEDIYKQTTEIIGFKVIYDRYTTPSGYERAKWEHVLKPDVFKSGKSSEQSNGRNDLNPLVIKSLYCCCLKHKSFKVENGAFDGPGYNFKWKKNDSRGLTFALAVKMSPPQYD